MGNLNSESCTLAETHVSLVMEAMFEGWEELDSECFPGANTVEQSEWAAAYKCEEDAYIYVYICMQLDWRHHKKTCSVTKNVTTNINKSFIQTFVFCDDHKVRAIMTNYLEVHFFFLWRKLLLKIKKTIKKYMYMTVQWSLLII